MTLQIKVTGEKALTLHLNVLNRSIKLKVQTVLTIVVFMSNFVILFHILVSLHSKNAISYFQPTTPAVELLTHTVKKFLFYFNINKLKIFNSICYVN